MKESCLHRVDRAIHDRRDLLARVAELVAELHREPLFHRKLRECPSEPVAQLFSITRYLVRRWQLRDLQVLLREPRRGAERVSRLAVGDPENPGGGLRVTA